MDDRVWYSEPSAPWQDSSKPAAACFLTRSPLTFGASQLRVSVDPDLSEGARWMRGAKYLAECVDVMQEVLPLALPDFHNAAEWTLSSGQLVKISVLRVSAAEPADEFRLHLVPLFESHLWEANRRFRLRTGADVPGGLIGWLGERDDVLDRESEGPAHRTGREPPHVGRLNLPLLAARLRRAL